MPYYAIVTLFTTLFAIVLAVNFSIGLGWAEAKLGVADKGNLFDALLFLLAFGGIVSITVWTMFSVIKRITKTLISVMKWTANKGYDLGFDLGLLL